MKPIQFGILLQQLYIIAVLIIGAFFFSPILSMTYCIFFVILWFIFGIYAQKKEDQINNEREKLNILFIKDFLRKLENGTKTSSNKHKNSSK